MYILLQADNVHNVVLHLYLYLSLQHLCAVMYSFVCVCPSIPLEMYVCYVVCSEKLCFLVFFACHSNYINKIIISFLVHTVV